MKKTKKIGTWLRGFIALVLMLCVLSADLAPAMAAVTQADIDALEKKADQLEDKKKEAEARLKELKNDKSKVLQRRKLLDEQIDKTGAQIENVEEQIADYEVLIAQSEADLLDAQEREAARYELFCKRVRAMEEGGTISYWSVLFGAKDFTELLGRLSDIQEVMDADQSVIDSLKALQAEIQAKTEELQGQKASQEEAKVQLELKKSELDAQRQEAIALINEINDNASEYQATLDELDREEEEIQRRIVQLSRELAAQNQTPTSSGGYIWPVDSRYITSTVGGRSSPGGVGSTNHKGTDIGRVGYNSKIYAAKAGTVIVSQYSNSYGHYVVVSHGSGNTTLYAHMSKRIATVGQVVKQGDVLGITGSTGHSTGPHLHFEVTENGQRINPLSHGAEPKKGYLSGYTLSGTSVGR